MALRRNAPDKVKLKMRGDGRPAGELGDDLVREEPSATGPEAVIPDGDGRSLLDWTGGQGAACLRHPDPTVAERVLVAGLNALGQADPPAHARIVELSHRLADGFTELAAASPELSLEVRSEPGLVWLTLPAGREQEIQAPFLTAMRQRGILAPAAAAPWIVSAAHDRAAVDRTLMAAADAFGEIG